MKKCLTVITLVLLAWINLGAQAELDQLKAEAEAALDSKDEWQIADAFRNLGNYYDENGDPQSAILSFIRAHDYYQALNDLESSGICQYNMGRAYCQLADFVPAMESFQYALLVFDSLDFKLGLVAVNNGLGMLHDSQDEFETSIDYYMTALDENKEVMDTLRFAQIYNNLAIVMIRMIEDQYLRKFGEFWHDSILLTKYNSLQSAFESVVPYTDSSIIYNSSINNLEGMAQARGTRNLVSLYKGDFYAALDEYNLILSEYSSVLSKYDIGVNKNHMAHCYMRIGKFNESKMLLEESKAISEEISNMELKMYYFQKSSDLNSYQGRFENALLDYKTYTVFKDSIFNEEKLQAIKDAEVKYETKAKENEITSLNRENDLKRKQFKYLIGGISLVTVLFIIAIYYWNLTRRKNFQIRKQKKEIDDSIQAARDIQFAVIPSTKSLKHILEDFFILFRPRDEVSGDFYWVTEENSRTFILTADSTGHGIPGAFVSMMGSALIREMIALFPDATAAELLDKLRAKLIDSLQQTGQEKEVTYGMDASLYILYKDKKKIDFAGAYNPLLILRDGVLIAHNGDRMPIGLHPKSGNPFTNHEIELQEGDTLFTYSDGYVDQFGGPYGKKYMVKRFKKYLESIGHLSMSDINNKLNKELDQWQGDEPQTDDILVIGVRV